MKKVITLNFAQFVIIITDAFFLGVGGARRGGGVGGGMLGNCTGILPWNEGRIKVLPGLTPYSQTFLSKLRTTRLVKAAQKMCKSEFGEFISMKKYAQLLLIECIRQSQKFGKVGFHQFKH
jgi:hypothetical protein